MRRLAPVAVLLLLAACGGRGPEPSGVRPRGEPGPRMTMEALHKAGGVPAGWMLTPPPGDAAAGRALFADLGCHSCHRVAGEPFAEESGTEGPELTGMGAHHPPAYFAEAIVNPDAVLVEGPGWIGKDGRSTMPSYPDLTVGQLADLVAYVASLRTGGEHAGHQTAGGGMPPGHCEQAAGGAPAAAGAATGAPAVAAGAAPAAAAMPSNLIPRPAPPPMPAKAFFVQSYEVLPGKAEAFAAWFQRDGARRFLAFDGLVSVETFVDVTRPGPAVTSVFGFRDAQALNAFLATHDPNTIAVGNEFDSFVGDHDHHVFTRPPIYKVPGLSAP